MLGTPSPFARASGAQTSASEDRPPSGLPRSTAGEDADKGWLRLQGTRRGQVERGLRALGLF